MTKLLWDKVGERLYETGVDRGVLYVQAANGTYNKGVAWNGLTGVSESPTGAESNAQYADNIKYLNLQSAEEFAATIEAFTYPNEFKVCDGVAAPTKGVLVGQQNRRPFAFAYRTLLGNDTQGTDYGYKLHLVWNAQAAPSSKDYATVNESPEAMTLSWEVNTTPVEIGLIFDGKPLKPTATLTIESPDVDPVKLSELETILYGSEGVDPRMPTPKEVIQLFQGTPLIEVTPIQPTFDNVDKVITIPTITGVSYFINNVEVTDEVTIDTDTLVTALPQEGYKFPAVIDNDWLYEV